MDAIIRTLSSPRYGTQLSQSTTQPQPPLPPNRYIIGDSVTTTRTFLGCCPNAQSYVSFSTHLNQFVLYPLPCNKWSCRSCAQNKTKRLANRVAKASPNRLLTLTIDPKLYFTAREAFDATRTKIPLLARKLRRRFGDFEYLRVTEVTARGWPHFHLLVRSGYIPHQVVRKLWMELTGATIVDIRQVNHSFHCYTYLCKYLSKMHELGWTKRHVSSSGHFFPKEEPYTPEDLGLAEGTFYGQHPATLLKLGYSGEEVIRFDARGFLLPHAPEGFWDKDPRDKDTKTPYLGPPLS